MLRHLVHVDSFFLQQARKQQGHFMPQALKILMPHRIRG